MGSATAAAAASAVISLKRGHLCETDLKFRSWRCVLNIAAAATEYMTSHTLI
jgi:hypothetical protein